jgi:hypothetical protein
LVCLYTEAIGFYPTSAHNSLYRKIISLHHTYAARHAGDLAFLRYLHSFTTSPHFPLGPCCDQARLPSPAFFQWPPARNSSLQRHTTPGSTLRSTPTSSSLRYLLKPPHNSTVASWSGTHHVTFPGVAPTGDVQPCPQPSYWRSRPLSPPRDLARKQGLLRARQVVL